VQHFSIKLIFFRFVFYIQLFDFNYFFGCVGVRKFTIFEEKNIFLVPKGPGGTISIPVEIELVPLIGLRTFFKIYFTAHTLFQQIHISADQFFNNKILCRWNFESNQIYSYNGGQVSTGEELAVYLLHVRLY